MAGRFPERCWQRLKPPGAVGERGNRLNSRECLGVTLPRTWSYFAWLQHTLPLLGEHVGAVSIFNGHRSQHFQIFTGLFSPASYDRLWPPHLRGPTILLI